jgi:hypothetical protein
MYRMSGDMVEVERVPETGDRGPVTGIEALGLSGGQGPAVRCGLRSRAEVLAQPLAHLLDRPVHLGHAPGAQDERVLAFGHRVDLGIGEAISDRLLGEGWQVTGISRRRPVPAPG